MRIVGTYLPLRQQFDFLFWNFDIAWVYLLQLRLLCFVCVCVCKRKFPFWPSTHWPLTLDLHCKSCGFLPFLHTLPKPLTTYLCEVLCTSCWKPGSCWPPVKEDPLHHGGDTLTVLLSLSEEGPLPPCTRTHTHTHGRSVERRNTMAQCRPSHFLFWHRCKCKWVHMCSPNTHFHKQFLLLIQTMFET